MSDEIKKAVDAVISGETPEVQVMLLTEEVRLAKMLQKLQGVGGMVWQFVQKYPVLAAAMTAAGILLSIAGIQRVRFTRQWQDFKSKNYQPSVRQAAPLVKVFTSYREEVEDFSDKMKSQAIVDITGYQIVNALQKAIQANEEKIFYGLPAQQPTSPRDAHL